MPSPNDPNSSTLLIVDDKRQNLRLISDFLAEHGFDLMLTRTGAQALDKVRLATPDLVLLDVRMPDMDGFEVCRRLKADPRTANVPVIFMTAVDDTRHKVEGFVLGPVDYITKPIQREELLARIQHHLQLYRLQKELVSKTQDLASKNAELEAYGHTIAHSLKTPLAAAQTYAFSAWMVGHVLLALFSRSAHDPLYRIGLLTNRVFLAWMAGALGFLAVVLLEPAVGRHLNVVPVTGAGIATVVIFAILCMGGFELAKIRRAVQGRTPMG